MGLLKVVSCVIQNHHARRQNALEQEKCRNLPKLRFGYPSIYPRSFGGHMITRPFLPLSTPQETKVKCHFLASVGA